MCLAHNKKDKPLKAKESRKKVSNDNARNNEENKKRKAFTNAHRNTRSVIKLSDTDQKIDALKFGERNYFSCILSIQWRIRIKTITLK